MTSEVFTIVLSDDELDGGYVVECDELPGCLSQGETKAEALQNIVDAIIGVLGLTTPRPADEEAER